MGRIIMVREVIVLIARIRIGGWLGNIVLIIDNKSKMLLIGYFFRAWWTR